MMRRMSPPDMSGKTCLVTGANTGIGRATALELARRGSSLIVACRSRERAEPVLAELRELGAEADFVELDLASLDSVRRAIERVESLGKPLHVLINNAGLAGTRGITTDGFELAFGVNYLGHFLLTVGLAGTLLESAPSRVVNVASQAHYRPKSIDYDAVKRKTRSFTGFPEYGVSKLAQVLFSAELARRLEGRGVTSYALHPGVVASDVWRRVPWPLRNLMKWRMISNEEGARTSLYCACDPELATESGLYYDECAVKQPSRSSRDPELAAELWRRSVEWTGADLAVDPSQ